MTCLFTRLLIKSLFLAAFIPSIAYAQDYTSSLIGHWKLDETSGTTATEEISGYNGTMTSGLTATTDSIRGMSGRALNFDGVGDYINMGDVLPLNGQQSFTLSTWVYFDNNPLTDTDFFISRDSNYWLWWNGGNFLGLPDNRIIFGYRGAANYDPIQYAWTPSAGRWYLLTAVHDATADTATLYIDGTQVSQATSVTNSLASTTGTNLTAARRASGSYYMGGYMDDIRIYNRALSAADISALYTATYSNFTCSNPVGVTGEMTFNTAKRVMQYCNSNSWIAMGKQPYLAGATNSPNGTYLRNNAEMSLTDGSSFTGSFWFKMDVANTAYTLYYATTNIVSRYVAVSILSNGTIRIRAHDAGYASGLSDLFSITSNTAITDTNWHHLAFSVDVTDTNKRHIVIDGVPSTLTVGAYNNHSIEFSHSDNYIGSGYIGETDLVGDMADFWLETGTYIDLSNSTNIQKFINNGQPVNLGADGSAPTGSAPDIFLTGDATNWNQNRGTAEDFSISGTLTNSTTAAMLTSTTQDITSGLVAYWKMNETTGSTISDSSGNSNNGTWTDGANNIVNEETVTGRKGTALQFDETDNVITVPHSASLDISSGYTFSSWVYFNSTAAASPITAELIAKNDGGGWGHGWLIGRTSGGGNIVGGNIRLAVQHDRDINNPNSHYSGWIYPVDTWNYVTVTWDGTNVRYYLNGALLETGSITVAPNTSTGALHIGYGRANWYTTYHAGYMDDLRLYNRALSDTEVSNLYAYSSSASCASPTGNRGAIVFNTTHHVMQYCDGANWIAMSKAGNGGGGCSNPAGTAGSLVYNSTYNVLQYCEGDAWMGVGSADNTITSGLIGHWKLDETSGSTIVDSSNTGATGTWTDGINNSVVDETQTGIIGQAIKFNNSSDSIVITNNTNYNVTSEFTISAWVKWDALDSVTNFGDMIVSKGDWNTSNSYSLTLYSGSLRCNIGQRWYDGTEYDQANFSAGQWYHLVCTANSSGSSLYVNGALVATDPDAPTSMTGNTNNLTISRVSTNSTVSHMQGDIDDVRIYNRALTASDVQDLFNSY